MIKSKSRLIGLLFRKKRWLDFDIIEEQKIVNKALINKKILLKLISFSQDVISRWELDWLYSNAIYTVHS